jgi:hypothetical protein
MFINTMSTLQRSFSTGG